MSKVQGLKSKVALVWWLATLTAQAEPTAFMDMVLRARNAAEARDRLGVTNGGSSSVQQTNWPYTAITNAPWQWGTQNGTNWSQLETNILSRYVVFTNLTWQTNLVLTRLHEYNVTNTFNSTDASPLPDTNVLIYSGTAPVSGLYQIHFDNHYHYHYVDFISQWREWTYQTVLYWVSPSGQALTRIIPVVQPDLPVYEVPLTTWYEQESGSFDFYAGAGTTIVISNLYAAFGDLNMTNFSSLNVSYFATNRSLTGVTP